MSHSESSSAQTLRNSSSQPRQNLTDNHPPNPFSQSPFPSPFLRIMILNPHGAPRTGPSDPSLQNPPSPPSDNNGEEEPGSPTTKGLSTTMDSLSMMEFLTAINAIEQVTTHRTVTITSAASVRNTVLTISLQIAHSYNRVQEFLDHRLPSIIYLLMDLRTTTVIRPPSTTSQTNHILSTESSKSTPHTDKAEIPPLSPSDTITITAPTGETQNLQIAP
uniref:Uncharacterized protein n=1 Tax=Moniliophthora roreri TaxID=221103 RepID=A0A0W0F4S7_MONRR